MKKYLITICVSVILITIYATVIFVQSQNIKTLLLTNNFQFKNLSIDSIKVKEIETKYKLDGFKLFIKNAEVSSDFFHVDNYDEPFILSYNIINPFSYKFFLPKSLFIKSFSQNVESIMKIEIADKSYIKFDIKDNVPTNYGINNIRININKIDVFANDQKIQELDSFKSTINVSINEQERILYQIKTDLKGSLIYNNLGNNNIINSEMDQKLADLNNKFGKTDLSIYFDFIEDNDNPTNLNKQSDFVDFTLHNFEMKNDKIVFYINGKFIYDENLDVQPNQNKYQADFSIGVDNINNLFSYIIYDANNQEALNVAKVMGLIKEQENLDDLKKKILAFLMKIDDFNAKQDQFRAKIVTDSNHMIKINDFSLVDLSNFYEEIFLKNTQVQQEEKIEEHK